MSGLLQNGTTTSQPFLAHSRKLAEGARAGPHLGLTGRKVTDADQGYARLLRRSNCQSVVSEI